MNKTTSIIIGIVLIIGAFFGGKAYGAKQAAATATSRRTAFTGANGGMIGGATGRGAFGGGTSGQVVSMDSNSITVSLPAGGSKIILYSPTTTVMKTTAGAISDVAVGSTIVATGTTNADGSVTATSIQLRPTGSMPQTNPTQGGATTNPVQ